MVRYEQGVSDCQGASLWVSPQSCPLDDYLQETQLLWSDLNAHLLSDETPLTWFPPKCHSHVHLHVVSKNSSQ